MTGLYEVTRARSYRQVIQQVNTQQHLKKSPENLLSKERHKILPCLPPRLKTGKLFNDKTIDDKTNKMQEPVSTLMNKIEDVFSEDD